MNEDRERPDASNNKVPYKEQFTKKKRKSKYLETRATGRITRHQ